jgi:hypothetical protein
MLLNACDDCITPPSWICPWNSRGACTSIGSGLIAWLTVRFHPMKPTVRLT